MAATGHNLPLISVVTPSYNQAQHLNTTLRSVIEQDYPAIEYVVIDGASSDDSVAVIKRFSSRLAYWESQPDTGQSQALNKGFRQTTGEILGWLNSDDVYRPGTLRAVSAFFGAHPNVDLVYGGIDLIDPDGATLSTLRAGPFDLRQQVCATNLVPQPATFFRRRVYERVGDLNENLHYVLDYEYWVRAGLAGAAISPTNEIWAGFRLHDKSKTISYPLRFADELGQVVRQAFGEWGAPPGWRNEAESNLLQYLGEANLRLGQHSAARKHFIQAAIRCPWRLKALVMLGFGIHEKLGLRLRGLYWRIIGRSGLQWLR